AVYSVSRLTCRSCRSLIEIEQSAEPRTAPHATRHLDHWLSRDDSIVESLVVPLIVVVLDVLRYRAPEMPIPDRNQLVEAFLFDRAHEPLRVCARMRRALRDHEHSNTHVLESTSHVPAPFAIAIADQDARRPERIGLGHR